MKDELSLGLDEAGRGPLLGPIVFCGVCGNEDELRRMNVRDSKQLRPIVRERLSAELARRCEWHALVVWPNEIDGYVEQGLLNELELKKFAEIIGRFRCTRVIVDAADTDQDRFGRKLSFLCGREVIARHRADQEFPCVSAASIIAKTLRDAMVKEIAARLGFSVGSGYPSDPDTASLLVHELSRRTIPFPYLRRSWEPVRRQMGISKIKKVEEFTEHDD